MCLFVSVWDDGSYVYERARVNVREREREKQERVYHGEFVYLFVSYCKQLFSINSGIIADSVWIGAQEFLPVIFWDLAINPAALLTLRFY